MGFARIRRALKRWPRGTLGSPPTSLRARPHGAFCEGFPGLVTMPTAPLKEAEFLEPSAKTLLLTVPS